MADIEWPADLIPYKCAFYLQPHVGGQESPLTRTRKVYGLSAPRWVARLSFRGGYDGPPRIGDQLGFGPRLDSLIADLQGGLNQAVFHDFRRPRPLQPSYGLATVAVAAAKGDTSITLSGFRYGTLAFSAGDYVGGDDRPHLVSRALTAAAGGLLSGAGSVMAGPDNLTIVGFNPPLSKPIAAGVVLPRRATGRFTLANPDDAGGNETEVGQPTEYVLDFQEDLT